MRKRIFMGLITLLGIVFIIFIAISLHSNLRTKTEVEIKTRYLNFVPFSYKSTARLEGHLETLNYQTHDYLPDGDSNRLIKKHAEVYVPYGYDPKKQYNIIYLMHGMGGNADTWLGTPNNTRLGKRYLDHLIQDKKMPPTIVVTPSYYQAERAYTTDDEDSSLTKAFGEELKNDLMPLVESKYHTFAKDTTDEGFFNSRAHRAFAGFSMGGVTTFYRMCDSMRYFKYFMPFSGSLHWGVEALASDDGEWDADYLVKYIKEQGYSKEDYFMYACCGCLDYGRSVMDPALLSMSKYPKYFKFGKLRDKDTNCVFGISLYEYHTASCRNRSLYNCFPVIANKMNEEK
ncbi:MAG: hypothetical protein K5851_07745 [Lachnospiraceae bacterium]|nr:hypothetical protein [Lachnospiraceae bacterium]